MTVNKAMSILIVDDYSTMRRIVRNLLTQLGFTNLDEAANGKEAIEKLQEKQIDMIISDWNMEPMTGFDLLKHVRADAKTKDMPFILVTAESKPENIIAAKQAGVSNYIVKPFSVDTLKSKIVSVIGAF